MPQTQDTNRQWILNERPHGAPDENTLRLEKGDVPKPGSGEMLLRTQFLSLDPYMRGRMSAAESYAEPVEVGGVMTAQVVAEVVESNLDGYAPGDQVLAFSGWQDYAVSDGEMIQKINGLDKPSWALGILGMPGFTAWAGLTRIGQPKEGETLVVAAATGPVGATVGQIAKLRGLRAVGIAGGPEKCRHAVEEFGFDACIDHRAPDFAAQLKAAVPDGIDIYFENVGGKVFDAVLPLFNPHARVPVCGLVANYNATALPDGPDRMGFLMSQILIKKLTVQGFIIWDTFGHLYPEFIAEMQPWLANGEISYTEEMIDGLEAAPEAFIGLLEGKNFGKRVIRVGD
ncbi:NADP-dependent oxidoreductase [Paracoccaceae bacterium GXU_MW_L88]